MKILIAVPTTGRIPWEFVNSIDQIKSTHDICRIYIASSVVHMAREQAAEMALKDKYDALLFLDDDMVFGPDIVETLLEVDAPVVAAPCFKRVYPYDACFYAKIGLTNKNQLKTYPFELPELPHEPFQAASAGTACMLIRTEVFEKLPKPYFLPLPYSGEDLTFCMRLAKLGIKIMIQPKARVGHLETRAIYFEHHREAHKYADSNGGADNGG